MIGLRRRAGRAEAADGAERDVRRNGSSRPGARQSFNEAGHKLGYWPDRERPSGGEAPPSAALRAASDDERDVVAHAGKAVLGLGALGVVYGDLGTSPLYTEQVIFGSYRATAHVTPATAFGVASLIFWALMVIVSIKYAGFIMRAHNRGDGGIMALTALLQRNKVAHVHRARHARGSSAPRCSSATGSSPRRSRFSARIQGVKVATPALAHLVVPLSVAILIGLFVLQRFGSGTIGWLFGPVILIWFVVDRRARAQPGAQGPRRDPGPLAQLGGAIHDHSRRRRLSRARRGGPGGDRRRGAVCRPGPLRREPDPDGLVRSRPARTHAQLSRPGGVHPPSPLAGEDAERVQPLLPDGAAAGRYGRWSMLAAIATVIASQAAISGSFSVAKQAVQLGFLPGSRSCTPRRWRARSTCRWSTGRCASASSC